ncbi:MULTISPECIES: hypothetical protein [unclassified Halorubrum]|uniref:hypothetical protein n=1 Tax=unclassified Halorubrum TaxID=2642239 RepID=UPI0011C41F9D|nr:MULTISPECIES: hypothetical protein [unclassified Halorubrum]
MKRRALLASLSVVGTSTLSGCSGSVPTFEQTTLGFLAVRNYDETAAHTFDIRVLRDGTLVHESTHSLKTAEKVDGGTIPTAIVDCTWDDVAGKYVVTVRVDGNAWKSFNLQKIERDTPSCVVANVEYGRFGTADNSLRLDSLLSCSAVDQDAGTCLRSFEASSTRGSGTD